MAAPRTDVAIGAHECAAVEPVDAPSVLAADQRRPCGRRLTAWLALLHEHGEHACERQPEQPGAEEWSSGSANASEEYSSLPNGTSSSASRTTAVDSAPVLWMARPDVQEHVLEDLSQVARVPMERVVVQQEHGHLPVLGGPQEAGEQQRVALPQHR